ncbi:MAG TPA: flavin reductase family protein [Actinomycetota bacterium]|nr:flavin reductase family protein [Actinomycetota bacterium]
MAADPQSFRQVMRRFPTGVTVLTMREGDTVHGMTANSFTAVSLDPVLILVCVDVTARAHGIVDRTGRFTVNILAAGQEATSRNFALREIADGERWSGVQWESGPQDLPRLSGCCAYLDCRVVSSHPGGDHTIFVAEVLGIEPGPGTDPLIFYGGAYRSLLATRPGAALG